jgi:hypothetical protein
MLLVSWFVVWTAGISIPMTLLAAKHWSPLPPAAPHSAAIQSPEWRAIHVLVSECGCSRRLARHLLQRGPSASAREEIVLIEPDPAIEAPLRKAGWKVRVTTPAAAETELGVEGGPFLLVFRPDGVPAYAGGHGPGPGRPDDWKDLRILSDTSQGQPVPPLAVFGCGVSSGFAAVRTLTTASPAISFSP